MITHTQGKYVESIKFFRIQSDEFLLQILPLLKQMKIYQDQIIYSQGDHAEESNFLDAIQYSIFHLERECHPLQRHI